MNYFSFTIPTGAADHVYTVNLLNRIKLKTPHFQHSNVKTETGYKYTVETQQPATAFKIGLAIGKMLPDGVKITVH